MLVQQFGVADKVAPFLAQIPIDGVFGLGLPSDNASGNVRGILCWEAVV